jgi:hypothetical protein
MLQAVLNHPLFWSTMSLSNVKRPSSSGYMLFFGLLRLREMMHAPRGLDIAAWKQAYIDVMTIIGNASFSGENFQMK